MLSKIGEYTNSQGCSYTENFEGVFALPAWGALTTALQ